MRPSSAASRVSTEGACGERAKAAETSTFASATTRGIKQRRVRRERRAAPPAPAPSVAALSLLRFASALELDQVRVTGLLLAELEPATRNLEVGIALRDRAAVLGPERTAYLKRRGRVRVGRLQLDVSARSIRLRDGLVKAHELIKHAVRRQQTRELRDRASRAI